MRICVQKALRVILNAFVPRKQYEHLILIFGWKAGSLIFLCMRSECYLHISDNPSGFCTGVSNKCFYLGIHRLRLNDLGIDAIELCFTYSLYLIQRFNQCTCPDQSSVSVSDKRRSNALNNTGIGFCDEIIIPP